MTISRNCLHYYLGLLQMQMNVEHTIQSESTLKALNNIIRTMQTSYRDIIRREDLSFFDFENINTNNPYFCKERNALLSLHDDNIKQDCLHYYCSLLKGKSFDECESALPNIIHTMKLSRHNKVCNEDFSNLDFGNIPFNGTQFSISGDIPCKFTDSVLNEANFQSGHSGAVQSVAWSPNGKYILSGSNDCTAILWDAGSGLMIRKLVGHTDFIRSVAFSYDGKYCITGSADNTAIIWNISDGTPLHPPLDEHTDMIEAPTNPPYNKNRAWRPGSDFQCVTSTVPNFMSCCNANCT